MSNINFSMLETRLQGVRYVNPPPGQDRALRACCPVCQPEGPRRGRQPALSVGLGGRKTLAHCFKCGSTLPAIAMHLGLCDDPAFDMMNARDRHDRDPAGWASVAALADAAIGAMLYALSQSRSVIAQIDADAAIKAVEALKHASRQAMRKGGA